MSDYNFNNISNKDANNNPVINNVYQTTQAVQNENNNNQNTKATTTSTPMTQADEHNYNFNNISNKDANNNPTIDNVAQTTQAVQNENKSQTGSNNYKPGGTQDNVVTQVYDALPNPLQNTVAGSIGGLIGRMIGPVNTPDSGPGTGNVVDNNNNPSASNQNGVNTNQRPSGVTVQQPTSGQPASGQPTSGQPASGQPASGQPASGQPASGQPASGQPATTQNVTPQDMYNYLFSNAQGENAQAQNEFGQAQGEFGQGQNYLNQSNNFYNYLKQAMGSNPSDFMQNAKNASMGLGNQMANQLAYQASTNALQSGRAAGLNSAKAGLEAGNNSAGTFAGMAPQLINSLMGQYGDAAKLAATNYLGSGGLGTQMMGLGNQMTGIGNQALGLSNQAAGEAAGENIQNQQAGWQNAGSVIGGIGGLFSILAPFLNI